MGSQARRLPPERRSADRPVNGDTRPCPRCGGTLEFSERYRLFGPTQPGWICDTAHCQMSQPARRADSAPLTGRELVRAARAIQALARRSIMKALARRDRSLKRIERSAERVARKRS